MSPPNQALPPNLYHFPLWQKSISGTSLSIGLLSISQQTGRQAFFASSSLMSVAVEAGAPILLGCLGMGRRGKLCCRKFPVIEECAEGARFREPRVPMDECTRGMGFRRNTGPPSIWSLPWDLSADAEFGGQKVQPRACTLVGPWGRWEQRKVLILTEHTAGLVSLANVVSAY